MSAAHKIDIDYLVKFISDRISSITGVKLGVKQYTLVKSRLNKRLRELGDLTPDAYMDFLKKNEGPEVTALVSLLTTHHSYFFREFPHFEYLAKKGLEEICKEVRAQGRDTIKIWCAAASRGQEVYSLSMFLHYHLQVVDPTMKFHIYGTDISDECVEISKNGVYKWREIKTIPSVYIGKHWARGTGAISAYVKAKNSIKENLKFEVLNLLDFQKHMSSSDVYDIVFCRNVFIYFEPKQIEEIVHNILEHMHPHAQLYLGLSESLMGLDLPIDHIGHSIYGTEEYLQSKSIKTVPEFSDPDLEGSSSVASYTSTDDDIDVAAPVMSQRRDPIRVVAVDDSPTVLKLIERILSKRPDFELVATAENGLDAAKKMALFQADVMTLDIHMPEQNGLEYLLQNYGESHPAVVMVSSVSREDATIAMKCFEAGASDYVEKPTLTNISLIEDELCTKLLSAYEMKNAKKKVTELDVSFKRTPIISKPEEKIRIVFAHIGDRERLYAVLKQFRAPQPPTMVLFEAAGNLIGGIQEEFSGHTVRAEQLDNVVVSEPDPNRIYFADSSEFFDKIYSYHSDKMASVMVLGKMSKSTQEKVIRWRNAHIIVEDMSSISSSFNIDELRFADQVVPLTSFAYESDKVLSEEADKNAA